MLIILQTHLKLSTLNSKYVYDFILLNFPKVKLHFILFINIVVGFLRN